MLAQVVFTQPDLEPKYTGREFSNLPPTHTRKRDNAALWARCSHTGGDSSAIVLARVASVYTACRLR